MKKTSYVVRANSSDLAIGVWQSRDAAIRGAEDYARMHLGARLYVHLHTPFAGIGDVIAEVGPYSSVGSIIAVGRRCE